MKEVVEIHNDMNNIAFKDFTEKDYNIFFSLCFKMKNQSTKNVILTFSELQKLTKEKDLKRFKSSLTNTYDKLIKIPVTYKKEGVNGIGKFTFFIDYFIDEDQKQIEISVHKNFEYLLNNFTKNFTKFELEQFVKLRSIYSKGLFRVLKQYNASKWVKLSVEKFRELLCIPETYLIGDINRRVINPAIKELGIYFQDLNIEYIKDGRKTTMFKFTWTKVKQQEKEPIIEIEDVEIKVSENLYTIIEKAKKNRFINPLLTVDNIELLLEMFSEEQLIKGLKYSTKEINHQIEKITYLIKSIKLGNQKVSKKIKVIQPEKKVENSLDQGSIEIDEISSLKTEKERIAFLIKESGLGTNQRINLMSRLEKIKKIEDLNKFIKEAKFNINKESV